MAPPSNNPDQKRPLNVEKRVHFSIWYFLAGLLILVLIQTSLNQPDQPLAYSEFRQAIKNGEVEAVRIAPDQITGTYREGRDGKVSRRFVTTRVEDPDLIKDLEASDVEFTGARESPWVAILSYLLPALVFVGLWVVLLKRMGGAAGGVMSIGKSKAKIYVETSTKVTFDDVAGIDEAEDEVKEVVEFLQQPDKFQKLGGRIPKGVLLVGPPGTGKTLLARAVAGESGVPFFSMSGSDFVEMFVGVGAARVRDLFQQAKERAPCIVFIDEMDALGKARGINPMGSHDEREQTLNQLLTEMDGFDANTGVILMAATNRPETLDIALLRPGRFDRQIVVDRPDVVGRGAILDVHSGDVELADDVDMSIIARRTPGMVGADLANVINEAALLAARRGKDEVTMAEFEEAIDRVIAGLERKSRVLNDKEREVVAFHEGGHAVAAECLAEADPVHRVSIIPRGVAALGYTMQLPTDERYLVSKQTLLDKLGTLLAGRAAESLVFDEISTGAANDLDQATKIATSMVTQFGMSDLGLISYGQDDQQTFLKGAFGSSKEYSEATAGEIDKEVHRILEDAYQRVYALLEERRPQLDKLAGVLIDKELIHREELRAILNGDCPSEDDPPSTAPPSPESEAAS